MDIVLVEFSIGGVCSVSSKFGPLLISIGTN